MDHLALYSVAQTEQDDDDSASSFFQNMRAVGGYVNTLLSLPFAMCGGGPVVMVEEGSKACMLVNGKLARVVGPGVYHYNVGTEKYIVRSMKIRTLEIPGQSMMSSDDVTVLVNAVCFYRISNIQKAVFAVEDVDRATSNFAQCTLRTVVGENTLEALFQNRKAINDRLTEIIDTEAHKWGVYCDLVEIKDIVVPASMQRIMAAVAESTREGNAKVITAEAELRASTILADAAAIMSKNPVAVQLRYFQTLQEIAQEHNSTLIVPSESSAMFPALAAALAQKNQQHLHHHNDAPASSDAHS
eukprot:TRINITY_DN1900_c1_g1_i1.p1 TRINITY_DN1900_c1_g1~~TRINITY_DN1900_c1_g1_i1.p1  ORF type:complete len:345 (+),score=97.29 TRINITY_DN1900_c1_g1_i1:134-1036(+)